MLRIVLITGISGSGKSVALRFLEDAGYTCVDNLPVRFLHEFSAGTREDGLERVAIAIDARSPGELAELPDVITSLRAQGTAFKVIFLDASDHTLRQRYAESRRRHPLTDRLRSEEHTSELQSLMRISYAVFCLKKTHTRTAQIPTTHTTQITNIQ